MINFHFFLIIWISFKSVYVRFDKNFRHTNRLKVICWPLAAFDKVLKLNLTWSIISKENPPRERKVEKTQFHFGIYLNFISFQFPTIQWDFILAHSFIFKCKEMKPLQRRPILSDAVPSKEIILCQISLISTSTMSLEFDWNVQTLYSPYLEYIDENPSKEIILCPISFISTPTMSI